jgi:uncharacterized protein YceK
MTTRRRLLIVVFVAATLAGCGSGAKAAGSKQVKLTESTTTTTSGVAPSTTTVPPATTSTTAGQPRTTLPTIPKVTTTTSTGGESTVLQLTSASHGTYAISVGETVELTLSDAGEQWQQLMVMPETGLLAPDPSPSPPANGILAIWTAVQRGTVTLTASEFVLCTPGMICPNVANIVREFQVILVIS